ncbi:hypothetical protein [Thermoactinomyces mirandus]|nr:hypothetical protein [Thermoactinomyces mirandus]
MKRITECRKERAVSRHVPLRDDRARKGCFQFNVDSIDLQATGLLLLFI